MKIQTTELTGRALDWAVAKATSAVMFNEDCEFGQKYGWLVRTGGDPCVITGLPVYVWIALAGFKPTTNWAQLGPLVSEHINYYANIGIEPNFHQCRCGPIWAAGTSLEIAACRAIVAAKLGDTVDVPEVLCQP